MIYSLTANGLTPGGSSTVHIYTQTIHRTTRLIILVGRFSGIRTQNGQTNWKVCGPCPIFASYTLAFALQLRKKHGKPAGSVAEECQFAGWKQNVQNGTYIKIRTDITITTSAGQFVKVSEVAYYKSTVTDLTYELSWLFPSYNRFVLFHTFFCFCV